MTKKISTRIQEDQQRGTSTHAHIVQNIDKETRNASNRMSCKRKWQETEGVQEACGFPTCTSSMRKWTSLE